MSIIHKYVYGEVIKYFAIVLGMVVGIYMVIDFLEKIDDFLEAGLPVSRAILYFIYKIPFIIAQITPLGILLAVLIFCGLMSKNNEVIALKSGGISIYAILKPVMHIGFIMSGLLFFLSEVIVPVTTGEANRIWLGEVSNASAVATKETNIWIKGHRLITHIRYYNPQNKGIFDITLNYFDNDFHLSKRIDAKEAIFETGRLVLKDAIVQNRNPGDGSYDITFNDRLVESPDFLPENLERVAKKSEEMSFIELWRYIKIIESEGYDASLYRVDLQGKIAFPLVCVLMCMIGTGIAVRGTNREGLPVSVAYGIGIAFLFWIVYSFCLSLGYGEVLPPFIAAWTANFMFACLGGILLFNAE